MTYAALQWTPVDVVSVKLADRHGSILVGVHLHKGESTVGLDASLNDVAEILEQWDEIILCCVRGEVSDITSCLPLRSLCNHHVVALNAMSREVVMTKCRDRKSVV